MSDVWTCHRPPLLYRKKIKNQNAVEYLVFLPNHKTRGGAHMSIDCLVKAQGSVPEGSVYGTCVSSVARLSKLKKTYRTNISGWRAQEVGSSAIGSSLYFLKLKDLFTQVSNL